jgi:hypothetical protein
MKKSDVSNFSGGIATDDGRTVFGLDAEVYTKVIGFLYSGSQTSWSPFGSCISADDIWTFVIRNFILDLDIMILLI